MKQNAWHVLVEYALARLDFYYEQHPNMDLFKRGTIFSISQQTLDNDRVSTLLEVLTANPDLFYRTPRARAGDDTLTDTARLVIEEALYDILVAKWEEIQQNS